DKSPAESGDKSRHSENPRCTPRPVRESVKLAFPRVFGLDIAMNARHLVALSMAGFVVTASTRAASDHEPRFTNVINVAVPHISTDNSVRYDYDIVYVRAPRAGDTVHKRFYTDFSQPVTMEPGADLMLLHPDGSEERLVAGGDGSITDPMVSF